MENDPQEQHVNRNLALRRAAPVAAALVLGAGAGVGIYAGVGGGSSAPTTPHVVASVPAQSAATTATSTPLTTIYKNDAPGVVDIVVTTSSSSGDNGFFGQPGEQTSQAEGAGFVYDSTGDIVTNAHVVDGETAIKVRFQDGKTVSATLVGKDESTDIAVIKVDVDASELHPLTIGSSSNLEVGQTVAAIGSPFGLPETMTAGIISALDRTITAPNNYSISGAIQTDAAINHGNSGGPLLNSAGAVIGVNAQIESNSNDNAGVGFAIPIDSVKSVADTIISGGTVQHAYLGVQIADAANGAGAQVTRVVSGSPADKAGLQAGDVITAIDGKAIANADELTARVNTYKPGDKATLSVTRSGSTKSLDITFSQRPS
ncbi:MAG: trypsin-like peptidase domain-containing protein [Actinomycetota bacterium]